MTPPSAADVPAAAENLFADAQRLQGEFWDALSALEALLDIEISADDDLENTTLNELLAQAENDTTEDEAELVGETEACPSCADKSEPAEKDER